MFLTGDDHSELKARIHSRRIGPPTQGIR